GSSGAEESGAGEDVGSGAGGFQCVSGGGEQGEGFRSLAKGLQAANNCNSDSCEWKRATEAVVEQLQHLDDSAFVLQQRDSGELHSGDCGKCSRSGGNIVVREEVIGGFRYLGDYGIEAKARGVEIETGGGKLRAVPDTD